MTNALTIERDAIIVNLSHAIESLRQCSNAEDVKRLIDLGGAAKLWVTRQKLGIEAKNEATDFVLHAQRRLGEILIDTDRHRGGRPGGKPVSGEGHVSTRHGEKPVISEVQVSTLKDLGISRNVSSQSQRLATVPAARFENIIKDAKQSGKEINYQALLKDLLRPEDATIVYPTSDAACNPEEIIADICAFIDKRLAPLNEEVRLRVGEALHQYASQLIQRGGAV